MTSSLTHFEELLKTFRELWKDDCLSDVELMGRNGTLKAHRVILAACSEIFREALDSSISSSVSHISLPDLDIETIEIAVAFMYHGLLILPESYKNSPTVGSLLVTMVELGLNEDRLKSCDVIFVSEEEIKKGRQKLIAADLIKSSHVSVVKASDLWSTISDHSLSGEIMCDSQRSVGEAEGNTEDTGIIMSTSGASLDTETAEQNRYDDSALCVVEETGDVESSALSSVVKSEDDMEIVDHCGVYSTNRLSDSDRQLMQQIALINSSQQTNNQVLPLHCTEGRKSSGPTATKSVAVSKILVTFQCQECGVRFHDRQKYNQHRDEHLMKEEKESMADSKPTEAANTSADGEEMEASVTIDTKNTFLADAASTTKTSKSLAGAKATEDSADYAYYAGEARPHECKNCGRRFAHRYNLNRHTRLHTGAKEHLCHHCGKAFIQKASLQEHINYRHPGMSVTYDIKSLKSNILNSSSEAETSACGMEHSASNESVEIVESSSSTTLDDNTSKSTAVYNKVLVIAPENYSDAVDSTVSSTMDSALTSDDGYLCNKCGIGLESRASLNQHSCLVKKRNHSCSHCGEIFTVRSHLQQHMTTEHVGLRPFSCAECCKTFTKMSSLRSHEMTHSGIKPHECAECGKAFSARCMLEQHLNIHTGVRPHRCALCEKTFTHKETLVVHMRTHTGEKPFQCQICGTSYTQSHHLKGHMLTHTGVKPYQCQYCVKSYKNRVDLRFHCLRIHQIDIRKRPEVVTNKQKQLRQQLQLEFNGSVELSDAAV